MRVLAELTRLLDAEGFEVEEEGDVLCVRREGMVNPADVRQRISQVLSERGYQGYHLKEVYAYMGSKKPWRTDEEGYVELSPWDSFKQASKPEFLASERREREAPPLLTQMKKKRKKSA